jgi:hypothetical protein
MPLHEEKQNLCNASGECTATGMDKEKTCRHHTPALIYSRVGMCILRSWYGGCMNPVASEEAKKFARRARQAINAMSRASGGSACTENEIQEKNG